jgi:hypothetical protein
MKALIRGAAIAMAFGVAVSGKAEAQLLDPSYFLGGVSCWDALSGAFAFVDCSGAIHGNNHGSSDPGETATINHINSLWATSYVSSTAYTGGSISGDFVLAVKGADWFSLFRFVGASGVEPNLNNVMLGVSVNSQGSPNGVSHADLYGGSVTVPEPGTLLLFGTGLLGMAFIRRREDVA